MSNKDKIRILELYSGIGGMHYGFIGVGDSSHHVVASVDINTTANTIYKHNFPTTKHLQRNIQSITVEEINSYCPDIITMSPPCQPFTRIGLKQDNKDVRTESLFHILDLLPKLKSVSYILLENVKGFEMSNTCKNLIEALKQSGFVYQEFLLNPSQFGIPNSRLRYYLLAKRAPLIFCFERNENKIMESFIPSDCKCCTTGSEPQSSIKDYIECEVPDKYLLPDKVLERFSNILDIVNEDSTHSCCFTKGYSHYVEGTGSVFHQNKNFKVCDIYKEVGETNDEVVKLHLLKKLHLRYFTPREVSNLMGFPSATSSEAFSFPNTISDKQLYRVLGNSVNVKVITQLLRLLLCKGNI